MKSKSGIRWIDADGVEKDLDAELANMQSNVDTSIADIQSDVDGASVKIDDILSGETETGRAILSNVANSTATLRPVYSGSGLSGSLKVTTDVGLFVFYFGGVSVSVFKFNKIQPAFSPIYVDTHDTREWFVEIWYDGVVTALSRNEGTLDWVERHDINIEYRYYNLEA